MTEVHSLLVKKHRDYGTQNLLLFGEFGILVRVSDKVQRLIQLHNNSGAALENETGDDTWMGLGWLCTASLNDETR